MIRPAVFVLPFCLFVLKVDASGGPSPFPDSKDESAWSGKGPIRVHPWMADNRKHFWTLREQDQGAVVFVGSSMMGNWKALKQAFPGLKVANRGIGGDVSRGLLFRFKEDVLDLNPRAVVISIGSNDLSAHGDPSHVEGNIAAIIDLARTHNPSVPVVVCQIPPRDNPKAPMKPGAYNDLNARIKALGVAKGVTVADLSSLAGAEGLPIEEFYVADRLHLSPRGYEKLGEILRPVLEGLDIK